MNAYASPQAYRRAGALFQSRSIRAQLIRILSVSLLLVLALLGVLVAGQINAYRAAGQTTRIVTVTLSVQSLVHQLQKERGLTNGMLGGGRQFISQVPPQRAQTDAALQSLEQTIGNPINADAGATEVRAALGNLDTLSTVRGAVDNGQAQPTVTFQFYTSAIAVLNGLELGLDQAQDGSLRHGLQALYALGYAKEYTGQERGLLNGVFPSGHFTTENYRSFAQILGQKQAALASYNSYATPSQRDALASMLRSPAATTSASAEAIAVNSASGPIAGQVDGTTWWNSMTTVINGERTVQQSVGADVTQRAETLRLNATGWLAGIVVLAVLAIGFFVALLVAAARSIIGPLAALTREADEVSSVRLPAVVDALQTAASEDDVPKPKPVVIAHDQVANEIGLVADALDRVQTTAFSLASEQALVRRNITSALANLGRRNQNLLRRQLGLISEFERAELDPSALANLFELDHLATRMRRNAESLLVLVGQTSPRPWGQPLPVTDVIRAALSEVDDYRRVTLRRIEDALISGSVVAEIAHMMAELVENALSFSPPDLEVEIYGRITDRGYLLVVVDHGVGMTQEELARARARLRDEENFLVTPTRFLGHYVVGRLAARLSVIVELYESPVTGITARMTLPADLLADRAAEPTPQKHAEATAEATSEPAEEPTAGSTADAAVDPAPDTAVAEDVIQAVAEDSGKPINGFHTKQITWPGGIPAELDPEPEPTDASAAHGTPSHATAGRNGAGMHRRPETERTRNGLIKRHSRARTVVPRPTTPQRQPDLETAPRDRTPAEVSSMLAAFRSGHQRGEAVPDSPQPPDNGQPPAEGSR